MPGRVSLAIAAAFLLGARPAVEANPIPYMLTYDFSGTFDGGPGSAMTGPFSGSFTLNKDIGYGGTGYLNEDGNNVLITLNNMKSPGDPQGLSISTDFQIYQGPDSPGTNEVTAYLGFGASNGLHFDLSFRNPGTLNQFLGNVQNFNFSPSTLSYVSTGYEPYPSDYSDPSKAIIGLTYGTITSLELVSTPEPGTLAVLALLGIATMMHRWCRGS